MATPPFIPGTKVRELVTMRDLIAEVGRALQWFSEGEEGGVIQPVRSVVPVQEHSGYVCSMCVCVCVCTCADLSRYLLQVPWCDDRLLPSLQRPRSQAGHVLHGQRSEGHPQPPGHHHRLRSCHWHTTGRKEGDPI